MTIFHQGAALVPDIVTEAEEERILLRISQAPWLADLSRRVQHYGFRYNYRGPANGATTLRPRSLAGPRSLPVASHSTSTGGCPNSASSTSTGPARGSACTPITPPSVPWWSPCRLATPGR